MRKTFSITNKAVLSHLNKQINQSKYIEGLIVKDMAAPKDTLSRDEVIKLIQQYIGEKKINTTMDDCVFNSLKTNFNL